LNLKKVTRVELIDESGRCYVKNPASVELSLQDDGRTLKVFVKPRGPQLKVKWGKFHVPSEAGENWGKPDSEFLPPKK
jgi:hypothetical protein